MIIETNTRYPASFKKQSISVDLSQIFNQDQYFRIYETKLESYVEIDRQTEFISNWVKMSDLLLFLNLRNFILW